MSDYRIAGLLYDRLRRAKMAEGIESYHLGSITLYHADCLGWLHGAKDASIHAVVTDPPFAVKEFRSDQIEKLRERSGGIWREPPSLDGNVRSPLPRFSDLSQTDRQALRVFFKTWATELLRVMVPGAHAFIASNPLLAPEMFREIQKVGFDYRGQIIRILPSFRGGDRPKGAEEVYPNVSTMPRGSHEPWGIFRKPLPQGYTVEKCLNMYGTGALRNFPDGTLLQDVIQSRQASREEREISQHPCVKPQSFMSKIVYSALPLGEGTVLDPFSGSGSTLAAALRVGYAAVGIELDATYFQQAQQAIPLLSRYPTDFDLYYSGHIPAENLSISFEDLFE